MILVNTWIWQISIQMEVNSMLARCKKYEEESIEPQSKPSDVSGDPWCHDFLAVPWLDPRTPQGCDYASEACTYSGRCLHYQQLTDGTSN
ncbi:hypothetical protein CEXT_409841 [Caerostris extrusa]|uniref:Uncharacterized protein n=1 Tax=Caerostris extrusa TaxID=172846 RepID=A0AAV4MPP7_CAEEX|nr:hypothetical protein CEXT_409841 [Caerostris extrusa]